MGFLSSVRDAISRLNLSISFTKGFSWTGFETQETSKKEGNTDAQ